MACLIEYISLRLKCIGSKGKETHVLKARHNEIIPFETAKLQAECMKSLCRTLSSDGVTFLKLDSKVDVQDRSRPAYIYIGQ